MLFKKHFDDKEIECPYCNLKVKPLLEKNNILWGMGSVVKEGNYIHICQKCKAVFGTK